MKVLFARRAYLGGMVYLPDGPQDVPDIYRKELPLGAKVLSEKAAKAAAKPPPKQPKPMTMKEAKGKPQSFVEAMAPKQ